VKKELKLKGEDDLVKILYHSKKYKNPTKELLWLLEFEHNTIMLEHHEKIKDILAEGISNKSYICIIGIINGTVLCI
jgi:hypothetical protein